MSETAKTQVLVIGAGPAGSALACYLARAGVSCLVVEAATFPRAHVGESLVPAANRVFREIGFLDKMVESDFVVKHGAVWTAPRPLGSGAPTGENLTRIDFSERPQDGVGVCHAWHVDRAVFDQMLARHAEEQGAEVRFGAAVVDADISAAGASVTLAGGERIEAEIVVDASGRRAFLGAKLGLKSMDPLFDQYAVHAWFRDFDRGPRHPDDISIHFLSEPGSWVWQIPISRELTSVGLVTQKSRLRASGLPPESYFHDKAAQTPELAVKLRAAVRANEFKIEADYSYEMKAFCGDRFLLIGDAARFVDPIFSSGVSVALNGARLAAPAIVAALKSGDCSRAAFQGFERSLRAGTHNWMRFIRAYYALNAAFTWFVNDPAYRLDLIELLQGEVYAERVPVLDRLEAFIGEVAQDPSHLWHGHLNKDFTGA